MTTPSPLLAQYLNNPQQLPPRNELERQVLDNLVLVHLQVQRAQSTGIRVTDAEIDQAMQRVAESNKIDVRQLRAQLEHDGLDYDDFRKTLRDQLLVQRLRQRVVQSQVNVTDSEVDILLASNSLKAGEVHLAHILVGVKDGASAEEIQAAKEKADSVKKQIDDGMDFSAAALRFSNAQDALQGGDLGWRRYDEVPEAFANLTEGMQPGQVSQVLRGPSGFHIVKLVDKRATGKQVVTEYHARHIQISVNEVINSDDAQKSVRDIRHRIVDGSEDFAKLAKQYSQDVNSAANLGGDMELVPDRPIRHPRGGSAGNIEGRRNFATVPDRCRLAHPPAHRHTRAGSHPGNETFAGDRRAARAQEPKKSTTIICARCVPESYVLCRGQKRLR